MGFDPFSPIAPAVINVLCVPAGRLDPSSFEQYLQWLRETATVVQRQVGDVSTAQANNNNAALLFNHNSSADVATFEPTAFFEPNRQPQIVLGLCDGSALAVHEPKRDVTALLEGNRSQLRDVITEKHGKSSNTILVVFGLDMLPQSESIVCVPNPAELKLSPELATCLQQAATSRLNNALEELPSSIVDLPKSNIPLQKSNSLETQRDIKVEDARRQSVMSTPTRTPPHTSPTRPEEDPQSIGLGKTISAGLLKLQMGLWSEALNQLADGARAARDTNSPAWHAKALEGVLTCLLLLAWAGKEFQIPQNCYPVSRVFSNGSAIHTIAEGNRTISEKFAGSSTNRVQALTAMLPGLLATIMNLYDRSTMGFDNAFPQTLISEARVRFAVLLAKVKRHGSLLNAAALDEIVGHSIRPKDEPSPENPTAALELRSSLLAALLIESLTECQANTAIQPTPLYLAVCQQLSELRLERKQGFFLKDILQKLPPMLLDVRKTGSTKGSNRAPSMNAGRIVKSLLQSALQVYGLPKLDSIGPKGEKLDLPHVRVKERLSAWLAVFLSGDIATKLEVLRLCVRVNDALPDLTGSIQFMSLLLFTVRQTITVFPTTSNSVPLISAEEQLRLTNGIQSAVNAHSQSGNTNVSAHYWDDFMVRNISLYEPAAAGTLMPHTSSDLSLTTASGTAKRDPFIYNPFAGDSKAKGPAILVKDEIATFHVALQNPLEVNIEVETLTLLSEGCAFEAKNQSVMIGTLCIQVFTLQGTPREAGILKIKGCKAKIKDCHEREFEIFYGLWKPPKVTKRKTIMQDVEVDLPDVKVLELEVVEPLPQLRISSVSLVQPSVMLLDGERCHFGITLENPGSIPADLVLFSYQDSVSRQLQEALAAKDLQPADSYELQYQLTHRPAIKRIHQQKGSSGAVSMAAGSKQGFEFEILGQPGLTVATILIDYAYLGKSRGEVEGTFYTRQLKYTVNITVNGSVDIHRCGVLAIPESGANVVHVTPTNGTAAASTSNQASEPQLTKSRCLLQLDLRSIWQSPITVTIETADFSSSPSTPLTPDPKMTWTTATSTTLLPAQYTRILVLHPQLYLADPHAPIPSLGQSKRQFVVSTSKLSLEAEVASRELFWYREEVCKRLRITWREEFGDRKREGEIDVRRGIRLSPRMIDALRVEHVQIGFHVVLVHEGDDKGAVVKKTSTEFELRRNVFAKLVVKVQNWTNEELKLLLRLQPSLHGQPHNLAMDLSRKFVWSGVLQRVIKGALKAGETVDSELGIVGLVAGVYEVNATVEEVRSRRREIEGLRDADSERRIWHARQPALIRVVDE